MGINQPANFDKTDYQTLPITYISLYLTLLFYGHAKRLCPYPIVGLGASLLCGWNLMILHEDLRTVPLSAFI